MSHTHIHTRYGDLEARRYEGLAWTLTDPIGGLIFDDGRVTLSATLNPAVVVKSELREYSWYPRPSGGGSGQIGQVISEGPLREQADRLLDAILTQLRELSWADDLLTGREIIAELDVSAAEALDVLGAARHAPDFGWTPGENVHANGRTLVFEELTLGDTTLVAEKLAWCGISARIYTREVVRIQGRSLPSEITLDPATY